MGGRGGYGNVGYGAGMVGPGLGVGGGRINAQGGRGTLNNSLFNQTQN